MRTSSYPTIIDVPIISGIPIGHVGKEVAGRGTGFPVPLSIFKGEQ